MVLEGSLGGAGCRSGDEDFAVVGERGCLVVGGAVGFVLPRGGVASVSLAMVVERAAGVEGRWVVATR